MQKTCPTQDPYPRHLSRESATLSTRANDRYTENDELDSDMISAFLLFEPLLFKGAAFTDHSCAQSCTRVEIFAFHNFRWEGDSIHIHRIADSGPTLEVITWSVVAAAEYEHRLHML